MTPKPTQVELEILDEDDTVVCAVVRFDYPSAKPNTTGEDAMRRAADLINTGKARARVTVNRPVDEVVVAPPVAAKAAPTPTVTGGGGAGGVLPSFAKPAGGGLVRVDLPVEDDA